MATTTVVTTTTRSVPAIGCNSAHASSVQGILKILQILCSIVVIILAFWGWGHCVYDGYALEGYDRFVGIFSLVISVLVFVFYLTNFIFHLPGPVPLIMFLLFVLLFIFNIIAGAITAWRCSQKTCEYYYREKHNVMAALSAFLLLNALLYLIDLAFYFSAWRRNVIQTTVSVR